MADARHDAYDREHKLLARLRAGDAGALDDMYLEYGARLSTFADRIAGEIEPAEDIVQDVFLALWERRERHRIAPPILAYLYAAVRNRALLALRRAQTAGRHLARIAPAGPEPGPGAFDPEQRFEAAQVRRALLAAIARLPERQHLALRMHFDDQLSPAEIADVLNVHEQAVRKLLAKAMTKLSAVMEEAEK